MAVSSFAAVARSTFAITLALRAQGRTPAASMLDRTGPLRVTTSSADLPMRTATRCAGFCGVS
jgi:hypothetical protein